MDMLSPMPRYRTRPRYVEAWRWEPDDLFSVGICIGWFMAHGFRDFYINDDKSLSLNLEDGKEDEVRLIVRPGDFILRGENGHFYPIDPDALDTMYEEVDEGSDD